MLGKEHVNWVPYSDAVEGPVGCRDVSIGQPEFVGRLGIDADRAGSPHGPPQQVPSWVEQHQLTPTDPCEHPQRTVVPPLGDLASADAKCVPSGSTWTRRVLRRWLMRSFAACSTCVGCGSCPGVQVPRKMAKRPPPCCTLVCIVPVCVPV